MFPYSPRIPLRLVCHCFFIFYFFVCLSRLRQCVPMGRYYVYIIIIIFRFDILTRPSRLSCFLPTILFLLIILLSLFSSYVSFINTHTHTTPFSSHSPPTCIKYTWYVFWRTLSRARVCIIMWYNKTTETRSSCSQMIRFELV